jgi:Flp pilus assembly protein TadG
MLHRTAHGRGRRRGASLVLFCFGFTAILFLTATAIDSTNLMAARRQAQNCCDAAALNACIQLSKLQAQSKTVTLASLQTAANLSAKNNNYTNGTNCTVTVNWPPTSGSFKNDTISVEVYLSFNYGNLVVGGGDTVTVRSVASCSTSGTTSFPMLILDPTASSAFHIASGDLTETGAPITVNSNSSTAAVVDGMAKSAAQVSVSAVGDSSGSFTPATKGGGSPMADPYSLVPTPAVPSNTVSQSTYSSDCTLNPGYYPNGLYITGGNVTLNPGLYYVDHGNCWINTSGTVTGNGVTIYHNGSDSTAQLAQDYGLNVGICLCPQNNSYTFNPPTSGPYTGMSFFQNRSYTGEAFYDFWGTGNLNVGIQYMPGSLLRCWSANNGGAINCNELVAGTFKLTGTHEIYGTSQNGGFSSLTWNATRATSRPPTSVYLAE